MNVIITVFISTEASSSTVTAWATSAASSTTHANPTVKCRNGMIQQSHCYVCLDSLITDDDGGGGGGGWDAGDDDACVGTWTASIVWLCLLLKTLRLAQNSPMTTTFTATTQTLRYSFTCRLSWRATPLPPPASLALVSFVFIDTAVPPPASLALVSFVFIDAAVPPLASLALVSTVFIDTAVPPLASLALVSYVFIDTTVPLVLDVHCRWTGGAADVLSEMSSLHLLLPGNKAVKWNL